LAIFGGIASKAVLGNTLVPHNRSTALPFIIGDQRKAKNQFPIKLTRNIEPVSIIPRSLFPIAGPEVARDFEMTILVESKGTVPSASQIIIKSEVHSFAPVNTASNLPKPACFNTVILEYSNANLQASRKVLSKDPPSTITI
jgi:hypothetical protein